MIGIDTNVLVRYITQDDPEQAAIAGKWIEQACTVASPGWIDAIVLCEVAWVLARAYGYDKEAIRLVLQRILLASELAVEHQECAWSALHDYAQGSADFSDYLIAHINRALGCEYTATFDRQAASHRLVRLLQ